MIGLIWRSIAGAAFARGYTMLVLLGVLIASSRILGPEGRGTLAAAMSWLMLLGNLSHLSLGQLALRQASKPESGRLPRLLGSILVANSAATLLAAIAVMASFLLDPRAYRGLELQDIMLILLGIPVVILEHHAMAILPALNRLAAVTRSQVVGRTTNLLFALVALHFWNSPTPVLAAFVGSEAILAAIAVKALHDARPGKPHITTFQLKQDVFDGLKLHVAVVGAALFSYVDVLLVNYFSGPVETSFYQLAAQMLGLVLLLPQAAGMASYGLISSSGIGPSWSAHRRLVFFVMGLLVPLAAGLWFVGPWLIEILVGNEFAPAGDLLQIMILALPGMSTSMLMASQWIARNLLLQTSAITMMVGIISVGCNLLLVPAFGARGAAFTFAGVHLVGFLVNVIFALWISRQNRAPRPAGAEVEP